MASYADSLNNATLSLCSGARIQVASEARCVRLSWLVCSCVHGDRPTYTHSTPTSTFSQLKRRVPERTVERGREGKEGKEEEGRRRG